MIKLLIAGYHGFGNCGDEAILQAMVTNIRKLSVDVDITALSYKPEFTKSEYGIKSVQRFKALDVFRAIKESQIVLSGGGTLLQDGTSTRSLMYYLSIIKTAKLMGKKVMLYANGIGPVSGRLNRRLVKLVVNSVDVITLREKLSESDLRAIGVKKPEIQVTADPAFSLESVSDEQARKILVSEGVPMDKPLVGVSVRAWSKAKYGDDFVVKLARVCDELCKQGKTVVLLPMEYPRDLEISSKLIDNMTQKAYCLKNRYTPSQILGIVGCFNVMISMRLHTLIFAAVKNVPMLGVIYDPKVEYYLRELEMPVAGDVRDSHLDSEYIVNKTNEIFENINEYKAVLKENADVMVQKASQNEEILLQQLKQLDR